MLILFSQSAWKCSLFNFEIANISFLPKTKPLSPWTPDSENGHSVPHQYLRSFQTRDTGAFSFCARCLVWFFPDVCVILLCPLRRAAYTSYTKVGVHTRPDDMRADARTRDHELQDSEDNSAPGSAHAVILHSTQKQCMCLLKSKAINIPQQGLFTRFGRCCCGSVHLQLIGAVWVVMHQCSQGLRDSQHARMSDEVEQ